MKQGEAGLTTVGVNRMRRFLHNPDPTQLNSFVNSQAVLMINSGLTREFVVGEAQPPCGTNSRLKDLFLEQFQGAARDACSRVPGFLGKD